MLILKETAVPLLIIFLVSALGYLVGSISMKGVKLGSSAIFLVGLIFGHLGVTLPYDIQTLGLALFIASVGLSAGSTFVEKLRKNGRSYLILCGATAFVGTLICFVMTRLTDIETPVIVGMMTGAYMPPPKKRRLERERFRWWRRDMALSIRLEFWGRYCLSN